MPHFFPLKKLKDVLFARSVYRRRADNCNRHPIGVLTSNRFPFELTSPKVRQRIRLRVLGHLPAIRTWTACRQVASMEESNYVSIFSRTSIEQTPRRRGIRPTIFISIERFGQTGEVNDNVDTS